jgi:hypothetical protein
MFSGLDDCVKFDSVPGGMSEERSMRSGVGAVATDLDVFAATSPPRVQLDRAHTQQQVAARLARLVGAGDHQENALRTLHISSGLILNDPV